MLLSSNVGLAQEGRRDTSTVAVDFRPPEDRGDVSSVAVEAPADDDRGIWSARKTHCSLEQLSGDG